MAIDLHPEAERRFVEVLNELLPGLTVEYNRFLSPDAYRAIAAVDSVLPGPNSAVRRQLASWIGEEPASDFVIGQLHTRLRGREFDHQRGLVPLGELPEFEDVSTLGRAIVDEFKSLPWEYSFFVTLPYDLGKELRAAMGADQMALTPSVELRAFASDENEYPPRTEKEPGELLDPLPVRPVADLLYLHTRTHGYVGPFGNTAILQSHEMLVRSIAGFLLAERIVDVGGSFSLVPRKKYVLVYSYSGGVPNAEAPRELERDTGAAFDGLAIAVPLARSYSADSRAKIIRRELEKLGVILSRTGAAERIQRACQWLFDSHAAENQLLAYVQATVVTEILMGEKAVSDVVGIGELLANRAAYLIGETIGERDSVLKDFRRIYSTRSRIVHAGHSRLSAQERSDLGTLRWICNRVIQEEVKLIVADPT